MAQTWDGSHRGDDVSLGEDTVCLRNVLLRSKNTFSAQLSLVWACSMQAACSTWGEESHVGWSGTAAYTVWHNVCQPSEEILHKWWPAIGQKHSPDRRGRNPNKKAQRGVSWKMHVYMTLHGAELLHLLWAALSSWQQRHTVSAQSGEFRLS